MTATSAAALAFIAEHDLEHQVAALVAAAPPLPKDFLQLLVAIRAAGQPGEVG